MNTIITCALTGDGDTLAKNPAVPVTPEEIAQSAIEAAAAGAAIVHIHVRDPVTTEGSRDLALYTEVVRRIRADGRDVLINLTAGMGGKLILSDGGVLPARAESDLVDGPTRLAHVKLLRPDICSLDCGSFNAGGLDELYVSTPGCMAEMARRIAAMELRAELECFDLGHVLGARQLVDAGLLPAPGFFQFALGVRGGAPADGDTLRRMRDLLPSGAVWAAFGVGREQFPVVAQAALLGGHVRVGLEDNLYLTRGRPASNAELVAQAVALLRMLGREPASPADARRILGLRPA